jgi:putative ABC transport system substrate-binding protein
MPLVIAIPRSGIAQRREAEANVGVLLTSQGHTRLNAIREQLAALGWIEGRNLRIHARLAEGDFDRTTAYASELVTLRPDVILAGGTVSVAALLREPHDIPIIFASVGDPVGSGFVESLARPGRSVSGFLTYESSLSGKWLQLLKEAVPPLTRALGLYHPATTASGGSYYFSPFDLAASQLGMTAVPVALQTPDDIEVALLANSVAKGTGGVVFPGSFGFSQGEVLARAALKARIPLVCPYRESALAGALIAYGINQLHEYRHAAIYVNRILHGERADELPVQGPTRFDLVINTRTAKTLGLEIPTTLLARADEVIE